MEEEGIWAKTADLMAKTKAPGTLIPVLPKELHGLLDYFCNPALGVLSPLKSALQRSRTIILNASANLPPILPD